MKNVNDDLGSSIQMNVKNF